MKSPISQMSDPNMGYVVEDRSTMGAVEGAAPDTPLSRSTNSHAVKYEVVELLKTYCCRTQTMTLVGGAKVSDL